MFNTDVWKWRSRSYDFGSGVFGLDFDKTLQKYHPGVTLMWLGTVGVKFYNLYLDVSKSGITPDSIQAVFGLHTTQKFLVVLAIGISLGFAFIASRRLIDTRYAYLALLLLILEPFFMAHTRTFHLEGLESTFMLVSTLWFYYWLQETENKKRLFIASFFTALAFLTKTTSLYLLPFFGLYLFFDSLKKDKRFIFALGRSFKLWFIWLFPALLFVFLLWPALWVDPVGVIQYLGKGVFEVGIDTDHQQFYFGKLVDNPGPLYYLVVLLFRSSPYLLVGLIGSFFVKKTKFIYFLLSYAFFYLVMITIPSKKLDRYILPSMTSMVLLSTYFYVWCLDKLKLKSLTVIVLFFILPVATAFCLHPDYLSYYNPMLGGLRTGMYVLEPKWMIGQGEIIKYFKNVQKTDNLEPSWDQSFENVNKHSSVKNILTVGFQEKYYTQIWPFFREFGAWAVIKDLTPFAKNTMYFVYPVWNDDSNLEDRFKLEFVTTIKIRGVNVYNVYKRS
ncbi:hypothetical protein A3K42_01295 [candidate division WWE3 bacterium RBG_13_37_7]|uniref:Glycosyltransferase RgtA/B/C/D-like domain-containing protein n=1 Tax=candidate division WWE3 bacterium RBG_13_37_7 TaxID=1802609 RepID=A0A1F4U259_UNCKA|nr:MAG: hypothetical protein A3K42_01295 [candidate division WWE3 bacterium RBG_13_37_7]